MAYSRKSKTSRRRAPRRRRFTRSTRFRRPAYRSRRRMPSRKALLNVTSRKKRDTMLTVTNTSGTGTTQPVALGDLVIRGDTGYAMLPFLVTARNLTTAGITNLTVDTSDRTSSTCYMKGFAEHLRVTTSSSLPWLWRRICFTTKDDIFTTKVNGDQTPVQPYAPWYDTTTSNIGMTRLFFNVQVNNIPNTTDVFNGIIFKGQAGKDWNDIMTAALDTSRITVKSDTVKSIQSNNERGVIKEYKRYYPMNSNLVYDDDENGAAELGSYLTTKGKPGMGDYYIFDYIVPGRGGTGTDYMAINATSTLYWHEK